MPSDKNNSFWLAVQYISAMLFSFITLKINIDYFGTELFGMWIIFSSVWGMGTTLDLGLGIAIIKYVAESQKHKEDKRFIEIISTNFIIFIILGFIIFFIIYTIAQTIFFSNQNIVPNKFLDIGTLVFLILGISFYIRFLWIFFKSILEGYRNFVLSSKLNLLNAIMILASVIYVYLSGSTIVILSLLYFSSNFIVLILTIYSVKKYIPKFKIQISRFSISTVKQFIKFSTSIQFANILGSLIDPMIKYLLGNYASLNVIPFYEVARRIATSISGLFYNTFRTTLPKVSVLESKKEYLQFMTSEGIFLSKIGITYSGFMFGIITIIISLIIEYWFGTDEIILFYLILVLPEAINNFGYTPYMFFIGIGKSFLVAMFQFINLSMVFIAMLLGLNYFGITVGLMGYFISVTIVNILLIYNLHITVEINLKSFFRKVKIQKLLLLIVLILINIVIIHNAYLGYIISNLVLSLISLLIFWKDISVHLSSLLRILKFKFVTSEDL
jgi:O-antigen/teichoic acid export membrane protein